MSLEPGTSNTGEWSHYALPPTTSFADKYIPGEFAQWYPRCFKKKNTVPFFQGVLPLVTIFY